MRGRQTSSAVLHTRQIRLAEVGRAGQERLEATELELSTSGGAGEIERLYLERAGARVRARAGVSEGEGAASHEHALGFEVRDPAARDFARGAHAALAALRRVWLGEGAR